jgi:hypothetical protein
MWKHVHYLEIGRQISNNNRAFVRVTSRKELRGSSPEVYRTLRRMTPVIDGDCSDVAVRSSILITVVHLLEWDRQVGEEIVSEAAIQAS